jgi:hypothetical protein
MVLRSFSTSCAVRALAALFFFFFVFSVLLSADGAARAADRSVVLEPFTGSLIEVELRLDDGAGDGTIHGRLAVIRGIGDLRGLFLHVSDASVLGGLEASGLHVTGFETGTLINLGQGNNVNGGGSPCPCDLGLTFGTPGIGHDDLQVVEFVLSHTRMALDLSLFAEQLAAARVTSVGLEEGGSREGSSKLSGVVPVPEPGTALLCAAGMGLLARRARRRG